MLKWFKKINYLPNIFRFISCWIVAIEFDALIVIIPEWTDGLALGIVKTYLLLLTSFSIWTASLAFVSLPFINLK